MIKRVHYNTTLGEELPEKLKFLSIEDSKRQHNFLEDASGDLLDEYEKKPSNK